MVGHIRTMRSVSCGTSHWLAVSMDGCMTKKQLYAVSSRPSEAGHLCKGLIVTFACTSSNLFVGCMVHVQFPRVQRYRGGGRDVSMTAACDGAL